MEKTGQERRPIGQELIIPALAVAFTAYYFWTVRELAWEAKANGVVIGLLLLALVALLVARVAARVAKGTASLRVTLGGDRATDLVRLKLMALMASFLVALPVLGTTIALALMLAVGMRLLGGRHWPTLVAVPAATALAVWATLILGLGTRFPAGPFERAMAALLGIAE